MSRMYIVNHWNDAAAYSGEQIGDRLKDSTALHFNRDGSANVELYSEETALAKKKTSVPLKDRILPQSRRVQTLTNQMVELCNEYKAGIHTKEEYSLLLSVISAKRSRAEQLLTKAINVKAPFEEEETEQPPSHTFSPNAATQPEFMQEKKENSVKNSINKGVQLAKHDAIIFLTGSAVLLMGLKFLF